MSDKSSKKAACDPTLLVGERIAFDKSGTLLPATDEELNRRYVKGEVRIVTESARYSLAGILAMLQEKLEPEDGGEPELRYKLDPEYQRRHRWNATRKSKLIESFLMNVPVPPVFLYERDLARFEVMDGRQRLTALSEFYADKLRLEGLEYWPELDGRVYSELPSKVRDGIDRRYISSIILLKETASSPEEAAKLKKIVFERLNSGGVALSPQETRNAIYEGPLNQLCLDLSKNADFRASWGIPNDLAPGTNDDGEDEERDEPTNTGRRMFERMDDVELVLRFFAYRQIESFPGGLNKISAFLDRFLIEGNRFSQKVLAEYRVLFESAMSFLAAVFGSQPFCRLDPTGKPQGRPNKIVYDPLMYVASQHSQGDDRTTLIQGGDVLLAELGSMYEQNQELFAGRRTNKADVQDRNRCMREAFDSALTKLAS